MTLVAILASYTLFLVLLIAAGAWFTLDRPRKVELVVAGVAALAVVGVLIVVSSMIWTDPRPFVVDGVAPAIAHAADNGFPSDHAAAAAAVAGLVLAYRRRIGAVLLLLAVAVGMSRVAAHVHHVPDILGGLVFGLAAAAIGTVLARAAVRSWTARRTTSSAVWPARMLHANARKSPRTVHASGGAANWRARRSTVSHGLRCPTMSSRLLPVLRAGSREPR